MVNDSIFSATASIPEYPINKKNYEYCTFYVIFLLCYVTRITIKPATKKDAHDFFRLEAKCFEMKEDSDSIYFWVPMLIHQFCYKAVIGTETVGGVIAMPTKKKNVWYINSLFVDSKYRRKGIADRLLKKIFSVAAGNDIVLDINPNKKHLFVLYGNHGFQKKFTSKNHYHDGEDRVTLEKKYT